MTLLSFFSPSLPHLPTVGANILHPSPRHIDGYINFHFTAPLWLKGMLVELGYVSLYWPSLSLILFCPRMIDRTKGGLGEEGKKNVGIQKERDIFSPLCLSVWQPDAVEMSGRLLCFPWRLKLGEQSCRQGRGRAGLGRQEGREGGRGGKGDPAGVWLRSNPGDYYRWGTHKYTHTSAGICCWRQSWLPWFPLVRGDNVSGHFAWRAEISQWMQDKQPFITLRALFFSYGCVFVCVCVCVCVCVHLKRPREQREKTGRQSGWERWRYACMGVSAAQRGSVASGVIDYPIAHDRRNKGP